MTNSLYGNRFIEKLVSSGYKNPTYAMAEIIDNSVDAGAQNIDIILVEEIKKEGGRDSRFISDVFFIDDGSGMSFEQINGCLKFSEGAGTNNSRIGSFGVGLPNSSIFVGRRVEVYSKDNSSGKWNYVFLDLDDQAERKEAGYDKAISKNPEFKNINIGELLENSSTIVRWSKIRNIGAKRPSTVIERTSKLIGRIYRYVLSETNISFGSIAKGNSEFDNKLSRVLPYDPLFLTESKTQTTKLIWDLATAKNSSTGNILYDDILGENEYYNTKFHYKKYIEGCKENQSTKPLFQKFDDFWNITRKVVLNGKTYSYTIRSAVATSGIAHPGIKAGGSTKFGRELRNKMVGSPHFNGGNISFIRTKREIDCGSYGLYSLTTEKERFWSIEIEFDSDLDKLMGLDYQKQNIAFRLVDDDDVEIADLENTSFLGENEQQLLLFYKISKDIKDSRKEMMKLLSEYARAFGTRWKADKKKYQGEENSPVQEAEAAVFRVLPKVADPWTDEEKAEWVRVLKSKNMNLDKDSIYNQVEKFSKGLHKTVVLYSQDETNNLFEIKNIYGKKVTFINTKHVFYENIIEPLKERDELTVFTTAIEMLICVYAFEMDNMEDDESKSLLDAYLRRISDRLNFYINKGQVRIDIDHWESNKTESL